MSEEKKEEGIYMCTILDEYWEKGIATGMEQGLERGLEQGLMKGLADGEWKKLLELVCKKLKKGKPQEVIAEELEESPESIRKICQVASAFAPEYERDKVYDAWKKQQMS